MREFTYRSIHGDIQRKINVINTNIRSKNNLKAFELINELNNEVTEQNFKNYITNFINEFKEELHKDKINSLYPNMYKENNGINFNIM